MLKLVFVLLFLWGNLCWAYNNDDEVSRVAPLLKISLGQTLFTVSGNLRFRLEYQDNYNIKQFGIDEHDTYFLERIRLNLQYKVSPRLRWFIQFQDAHVLGLALPAHTFKPSNPYFDISDIRQGFMELSPLSFLTFKIGRQQIAYGDRRLFGPGQWGNTGRYAWDAAIMILENDYFKSHLLIGRYLIRDPNKWPNPNIHYPTGYAMYTTIKKLPFNLDLIYVLKRDSRGIKEGEIGKGVWNSHSLGWYINGKIFHFNYANTFVYQFGWWGRDRIRAYGLNLQLGYTFSLPWQPQLILQYTCGSGDKDPNDGIHGTFDGVFGGIDRFYGRMNLFSWMNLRDYEVDLKLKPIGNLLLKAAYHYFTLDDKRDAWYYQDEKPQRWDKTGESGRGLGHEVDLEAIYNIKNWELRTGFSTFFASTFIKNTGPSLQAYWYFFQAIIWF